MRTITVVGCSLFLALACNSPEGSAPAISSAPVSSVKLYDEGLREQPCELLTPAMVASVTSVPEDQVEQRAMSSMCLYSWEGGNASIAFVKTYDSAEEAAARFQNEHQGMTGAEVQVAMAKIGEGAKKKLEEDAAAGKDAPDSEHVDPVIDTMGNSMGGGITFEAVEGLGDSAAYETTRHETEIGDRVLVSYANKLDVLIGNLSFDVTFVLDGDGSDARMFRDENIALARAVIDGLPR